MNERSIFIAALDKENRSERAAYLDQACAGDAALRQRIERLLLAHERDDSFLAEPAPGPGATAADVVLTEGPGTRIGPFKLLQQIGEGGMGIVYMAEQQEPVRRKVALKIIKPGMDSAQVIARFEAERQALALMDHQNIARVLDAGAIPGEPGCLSAGRLYFVMELVHGVPITQFCDDNQLTPRERLELFMPVCQAIQHAHQKGIIHRDIKPSNVLVTMYDDKPVPKVIDFGVAKAIEQRLTEKTLFTQFGFLVGTFEYMSPEQAEMNAFGVDTRSDIYSLGVLLYELLTSTTPLQRERLREAALTELVRLIKEEEPPRPSVRLSSSHTLPKIAAARKTEPAKLSKLVRGEIDWIVMKCLEKDRTRRYETANALARDVERYLHDEPVEACPPSAAYRLRKSAHKYRMFLTVAAAFILLLMISVVVSVWQAVRARDAEREATRKRQQAEAAQERAQAAENDAKNQAEQARRQSYAANMNIVQAAWESHNMLRVRKLLMETAAFQERGFEWYYWQQLARSRPRTLVGHKGGVIAVVFSPDGQRLVTGGKDGTARVWDASTGKELFVLRGHRSQVSAVAFSPDGQWLVTGSTDGTVRVWDAGRRREVWMLQSKTADPVWAIAVTLDGKRVVAACEDATARVWDAASGQELFTLKGHTGRVWSVAATPDGRRLITGSADRTARVWDATSGRELLPPLKHPWDVTSVAISANGQMLLTVTGDPGLAKCWNAVHGRELPSLRENTRTISSMTLTPDGKRVVTGGRDGVVRVWDTATNREILTLIGDRLSVCSVAVSADGQRLATGSLDGTARLWEIAGGQRARIFNEHSGAVLSVAVSPDGQRIITAGQDGTARIWDMLTGRQLLKVQAHTGPVHSVAVSPDAQRIFTGDEDGTVRAWDANSGHKLLTLKGHKWWVRSIAVTSAGKRIATGDSGGLARLWDAVNGHELLKLTSHSGPTFSVVVTLDGKRLVTGGLDGKAKVWDALTGRHLTTLPAHTGAVSTVTVTPDGQRIITGGSEDGAVRVWDAVSGREVLTLEGHTGPVTCVTLTPDGQRIVAGGDDGTARIWEAVSGRELLALKGHTGRVWSIAATSDGQRIITGGEDGTVRIWEAASPEQVALWHKEDEDTVRRLAPWQRPEAGTRGFIWDWLVLAPLVLQEDQSEAEGLDYQQLPEEARLRPWAGHRLQVGNQEFTWHSYRAEEPVLDLNQFVGRPSNRSVAYLVCYVMSDAERNDLLLQVGSDDQSKVYLNGQEIYKYTRPRSLVALDPIGPITLHKGTNVLVLKVVNADGNWECCARFVDSDGNPADGLGVSLTPE
jgi:WD40 repeat protein/serine/threonine protein kinase